MCSIGADDALAGLEAGLDAVAAVDLDGCSDADLLDRARELVAVHNRVAAELTRVVHKAETRQAAEHDGLKTMASWLRTHTRLSGAAAGQLTRRGRVLDVLPAVQASFASGLMTAEQVDVIAPVVKPENLDRAAEQGVDLAEIEATALTVATTLTHDELRTVIGTYLARLDPDGTESDPTEARQLTLSRLLEGRWHGTFDLDDVGGEKVATALEAIAAASRCAGDDRSPAQRRGDALVQLADLALASGQLPVLRTVKPHVIVTIPLTDLTGHATDPAAARTGMDGVLSAAKARWIACDATLTRLVLDPDGLPLDVGREKRVVPPHIRRAVVERDRTCVFTGCQAPHWWCDVHHLVEWINDGETSLDNSGLLCERHHAKVHHGFRVERQPDGRWRTYRPDGTEILTAPPLAAA